MISSRGGFGERREDAAAVEPAHAAAEDRVPVEVARLQLRGGLVGAVVEDDRRAHAVAAIAVDGGHVRPADAVVLEALVERRDPHRAHLRSATSSPIGYSTIAVAMPVRRPKQSARLAATLNSPPLTWIVQVSALRNGTTPGSSR